MDIHEWIYREIRIRVDTRIRTARAALFADAIDATRSTRRDRGRVACVSVRRPPRTTARRATRPRERQTDRQTKKDDVFNTFVRVGAASDDGDDDDDDDDEGCEVCEDTSGDVRAIGRVRRGARADDARAVGVDGAARDERRRGERADAARDPRRSGGASTDLDDAPSGTIHEGLPGVV